MIQLGLVTRVVDDDQVESPVAVQVPGGDAHAGPRLAFGAQCTAELESTLDGHYRLHYVFVDDGSSDGTSRVLEERFGSEYVQYSSEVRRWV